MKLLTISTSELKEHPKNKEYFQNISGEFWKIFCDDIRENGIREPLTVNSKTKHVVKGNQRLRAANEIGIEKVQCFLVSIETEEEEIDELIRDNVLRRDIDIFTKFTLVNKLRERIKARPSNQHTKSASVENQQKQHPRDQISKIVKESVNFVSMADLFNALPSDKQQELKDWFYKHEVEPSQKEMKTELDRLVRHNKTLDETLEVVVKKESEANILTVQLKEQLKESQKELQELSRELNNIDKAKKIMADIETIKSKRNQFAEELDEIKQLVNIEYSVREILKEISPIRHMSIFTRETASPAAMKTLNSIIKKIEHGLNDLKVVAKNELKVIEVSNG